MYRCFYGKKRKPKNRKWSAIASLALNPRPQGYKKLKGTNAYRIRSGNYRIIYEIHDSIITVVVIDVGHRKEIYRRL